MAAPRCAAVPGAPAARPPRLGKPGGDPVEWPCPPVAERRGNRRQQICVFCESEVPAAHEELPVEPRLDALARVPNRFGDVGPGQPARCRWTISSRPWNMVRAFRFDSKASGVGGTLDKPHPSRGLSPRQHRRAATNVLTGCI